MRKGEAKFGACESWSQLELVGTLGLYIAVGVKDFDDERCGLQVVGVILDCDFKARGFLLKIRLNPYRVNGERRAGLERYAAPQTTINIVPTLFGGGDVLKRAPINFFCSGQSGHAHNEFVLGSEMNALGYIERERRVCAFVSADIRAIEPDIGAIARAAETELNDFRRPFIGKGKGALIETDALHVGMGNLPDRGNVFGFGVLREIAARPAVFDAASIHIKRELPRSIEFDLRAQRIFRHRVSSAFS